MMTGQPWGFWEYERIVLQVFVLALLTYAIRACRCLIQQGKDDRAARELAIKELKHTADALAARTAELARLATQRDRDTSARLDGRFDSIDKELGRNTQLTVRAADASATAADVANAVNEKIVTTNEKIEETNKRLLEHVVGADKKTEP